MQVIIWFDETKISWFASDGIKHESLKKKKSPIEKVSRKKQENFNCFYIYGA